jgi:hypothetical protein
MKLRIGLMLFLMIVAAQTNLFSQTRDVMSNDLFSSNFGSGILTPENTRAKPFKADYEQVVTKKAPNGPASQQLKTGTICRDSEGRSRNEISQEIAPGVSLRIAVIFDPSSRTLYVLEEQSKTVTEMHMPEVAAAVSPEPGLQARRELRSQDLGEKQIEGLVCQGRRIEQGDSVVEYWYSPELMKVLFEKRVSDYEESTSRLFNIRRIEPDRELFNVPADYKEVK